MIIFKRRIVNWVGSRKFESLLRIEAREEWIRLNRDPHASRQIRDEYLGDWSEHYSDFSRKDSVVRILEDTFNQTTDQSA